MTKLMHFRATCRSTLRTDPNPPRRAMFSTWDSSDRGDKKKWRPPVAFGCTKSASGRRQKNSSPQALRMFCARATANAEAGTSTPMEEIDTIKHVYVSTWTSSLTGISEVVSIAILNGAAFCGSDKLHTTGRISFRITGAFDVVEVSSDSEPEHVSYMK